MKAIFLFALLASLLYSVTSLSFAAAPEPLAPRLIVKFKDAAPENKKDALIKKITLRKQELLRQRNTITLEVSENNKEEKLKELQSDPLVEYAEQDFIAEKVSTPNDPQFSSQWGLTKIQADRAWDTQKGSATVDIAILDSGIDGNHPDVGPKVSERVNFTINGSGDVDGHGTHVAGIASALTDNTVGIAGTIPTARLMSVKVLGDNGSGYYSWIANGITWAADNGAEVINMSLGGTSSSKTLQNAVQYAFDRGVVIVAAAGNNGSTSAFYPAYYDPVIAVGATTTSDGKASFSNYGSWVDVAAPGSSILSTYKGGYANLSGTSMASPFVAGVAALIKSRNPGWSNTLVRSKLESSSDSVPGNYWRFGRINACRAVDCVAGSATPTPTPTQSGQAPTPTPTATPTPSNKPWYCKYIPTNSRCL